MKAHRILLWSVFLIGCRIEGHYVEPDAPPPRLLTVHVGGNGAGSVVSEPAGLECSMGTCLGGFTEGTVVQLSASATTGFFLGWAEACQGQGTCTVTMDRERVVGALFGKPGEALWVKQLGGTDSDSGESIAIDSNNDLIVVGSFRRTTMAGPELTSNGDSDAYVVKLASSSGNIVWAKRFGGTLTDEAFSVVVDGARNVYISGAFKGTVDFGSGPLTATGSTAIFVLKLDPNGSFVWAQKIENNDLANRRSVIATNGNSVIVAGGFFGSITVGTTTATGTGTSPDMFVLRMLASTGEVSWVKSFAGTSYEIPQGATLDSNGNAVIAGRFSGTVNFGGGVLAAPDSMSSGFLLKVADVNGAHLLSKRFGGSKNTSGAAIAVDSANNIFVIGDFLDTVDFGCTNQLTATQADIPDVFLVKYTQAGSCIWAKGFGGTATAAPGRSAAAIAVNNSGDVAVAGSFCGSIWFDGKTLTSASACSTIPTDRGMDVFAARFAGDGMHLNSIRAGGTSDDYGRGIAQGTDGRLFVTGRFNGFTEFGGSALNSIGASDTFIAGFGPL